MATVTVYTADRMKDIENESVVSGQVVGDNLILTKYDKSVINAGNVRGPKGTNGAAGYTSIVVCSSTSRPTGAALFNGLAIYETDTNKFLIWNGIRWDPPWNTSWGVMAISLYTNTLALPTGTNLITLSNIPVIANRRLRLTAGGLFYSSAVGDVFQNVIMQDGAQIARGLVHVYDVNTGLSSMATAFTTPNAGNHTFLVRVDRPVGTGQVTISANANEPWHLLLEDIGPNGAPA
jgi:hypothetical protein